MTTPLRLMITGCDGGLGLALVRVAAAAGHLVHAGHLGPAPDLMAERDRHPGRILPVHLDLRDPAGTVAVATLVGAESPGIDVLINNAGVTSVQAKCRLEELDLAHGEPQSVLEVNTFGTMRVTQAFLPLLRQGQGRRTIVMISSEAGSIGASRRVHHYAYCMSKAALNMFTRLLRNDLEPQGFTIFAVQPGWMRGGMSGSDAALDPAEPAAAILGLLDKVWRPDEPFFIDWQGHPLPW